MGVWDGTDEKSNKNPWNWGARERSSSARKGLEKFGAAAAEKKASRSQLDRDYGGLVDVYEQQGKDLRGVAAQNKAFTRSQLARNAATSLGGLGGMRGGGGIAAMGDATMQGTRAAGQMFAQDIARAGQAEIMAKQAGVEATQAKWEAGSEERDYAEAIGGAETEIAGWIKEGQGALDDDETGILDSIEATIKRTAKLSPLAAEELRKKYLDPAGEGYKKIHSWGIPWLSKGGY